MEGLPLDRASVDDNIDKSYQRLYNLLILKGGKNLRNSACFLDWLVHGTRCSQITWIQCNWCRRLESCSGSLKNEWWRSWPWWYKDDATH